MMHGINVLYAEMSQAHIEIDRQIEAAHADFRKMKEQWPHMKDMTIYDMKTRDGAFVLSPLLAIKAQLLAGMASLKAADVQAKNPGKGKW